MGILDKCVGLLDYMCILMIENRARDGHHCECDFLFVPKQTSRHHSWMSCTGTCLNRLLPWPCFFPWFPAMKVTKTLCGSRKNPYPPHGRSLAIPRGRGVLKAKLLEEMYEKKTGIYWGVGEGRGVQNKKNLPLGECGYFLELHIWQQALSGPTKKSVLPDIMILF